MQTDSRPAPVPNPPDPLDAIGHPKGTLAIVFIFGALFALGWFAFYVLRFMERGAPHAH
jgi:hypothetical protein